MAAIERLINRKVESRVIEGFEPGTASRLPAEPRDHQSRRPQGRRQEPRRQEARRQEQPRRPQQQQQRPQRDARPARPAQPRSPGSGWQDRNASRQNTDRDRNRGQGFQRRSSVPATPVNHEYQAQVEEARKRMREEGETPVRQDVRPAPRRERPLPALFARKVETTEQ